MLHFRKFPAISRGRAYDGALSTTRWHGQKRSTVPGGGGYTTGWPERGNGGGESLSRRSLHGWFALRPSSGRCSPSGRQFSIVSRHGRTWILQARATHTYTHIHIYIYIQTHAYMTDISMRARADTLASPGESLQWTAGLVATMSESRPRWLPILVDDKQRQSNASASKFARVSAAGTLAAVEGERREWHVRVTIRLISREESSVRRGGGRGGERYLDRRAFARPGTARYRKQQR